MKTSLLLCAIVLGLASPSQAQETWPPAHLKNLPPDYLDRIRASLEAGSVHLGKVSSTDPKDSIGWVRYGMPSLILGKKADEINRFFESETFVVSSNPKFGFSLFGVSYVRLYGLMNDRTGPMKGLLTKKAQENFEKGFWEVARANSKISESRRGIWEMEGSENHHLSSKTCDFLVVQFLRNIPEYAALTLNDGSTLAEQYEIRRNYFLNWFDERAKRGQFVEAASPSYQADSISAIFNVRDFAEDPVLRRKADLYLDLVHAVLAEETLLTTRGGPKSRVKVGHEYDGGFSERGYDLLFNAPGRTYNPLGVAAYSTSDYYPSPAIVSLARDTSTRGIYAFTKRWPGPVAEGGGRDAADPDGPLWRTLDPERSVLRYGFATPNYVLGTAGLDPRWIDDTSMGYRWQGAVFASDPLARIGFEVLPAKDKDWHGFNPFFSVQDRNLLITQRWAPIPPNPKTSLPAYLRVYFSPTLDAVEEENGWIFARDGAAFAALRVVSGGYEWTPAWKPAPTLTKENKAFITLKSETSPVIMVVNDAADYPSFAAFKAAVVAQPVREAEGGVEFATLTFHGLAQPPKIEGKGVNLAPGRGYDSPFIRSEWGSGLIYIRKGDETQILDFRDPLNPKKQIGVPVTADFPSGHGDDSPIVFR